MDENKKKVILERLKTTGQYEEFRKAIKAAGSDPWILIHESGQVLVMGYEGGRFTKTGRTFFDSENQNFEPRAFTPATERMVGSVIEFLEKEGVKLKDNLTGAPLSGKKLSELNRFDRDSKLDLAIRYLEQADIALDTKSTTEDRLGAAYELGNIWRSMVVNNFYGQTQKKIAKTERKRGLSEIFENLKAMKNAGSKPKELWPEFIAMLGNEEQYFDNVQEVAPNPQNCKTWSVSFVIIPNKDGAKHKDEHINYGRFVRRLNEK